MPFMLQNQRFGDVGMSESGMSVCNNTLDNLEHQDRLLGSGCITTRWLELFLTYHTVGAPPPSNNPAAGSLHHRHTFVEQISAQSLLAPSPEWD